MNDPVVFFPPLKDKVNEDTRRWISRQIQEMVARGIELTNPDDWDITWPDSSEEVADK